MGSESTIEIRDGFVAAGVCGNRESHGDKRLGIEALGHRNGSIDGEMKLQIESVSGTGTRPWEEMNYSGGGVRTWTSRTELKGDPSWSWWCEPRHRGHRQVEFKISLAGSRASQGAL